MGMDDLDLLIATVEAGEITDATGIVSWGKTQLIERVVKNDDAWCELVGAHDGSVDAAIDLVERLLPGWEWAVTRGAAGVISAENNGDSLVQPYHATAETTARALLLATLRAYRDEVKE